MKHRIEAYGSLLNPCEREKLLEIGTMRELGKVRRIGWKLAFDKHSSRWNEAVLNLVWTGRTEDVYYTTVYEVSDEVYDELAKREMGSPNARRWERGDDIPDESYRPVELDSPYGATKMFIIPQEGRRPTSTTWQSSYVHTVKEGIGLTYEGEMKETNLMALRDAVSKSSSD